VVPVVTAGVVAAAVMSVPERHLFYELPWAIVKELAGGEKDVSELRVVGASMDATKDSWYLRKLDNDPEHGGNSPPPTP